MSAHKRPVRPRTDSDASASMIREQSSALSEDSPSLLCRLMELPVARLSRQQLRRLDEHRYSSDGRSLLEPIMQWYWCWLVSKVPLWMAPNLITIVGLATNIISTLILVYYCPTATEQAPTWVYMACALGLFIYQSLDAIDGKQARRTNSSTPLGELFDHGCDSLSTDVCFRNSAIWDIPVINIQFKIIPALLTLLGAIFSCTNYFRVIFTGGMGKNGSTIAGTSVLSPSFHIGVVITLALMIYKKSSVQLFERHPCLYTLAFGCVSAKLTNRLVVAHMTKSEMHRNDLAFTGPALLFLNQYFNSFIDEYLLLWVALVLSAFDLVRYCVSVCNQIAAHLKISVFSIQPPSPSRVQADSKNHH
ncbi:hypothetical protein DNTS_024645 [Danionella cerebrum]|uniref:Choline/ethanolaminephosphotransferase 1 n=1 Tax=Danionella cerebrum TaxID=2873325 RepID=A0A553NHS6_9TELE|nr:hypothetical protein DNTS_024645 [Danionella translucida]TRY64971.1 hypothetical protein DNTS_024645 [Danionella translucida]